MKKFAFLSAAGLMMLAACSNEEVVSTEQAEPPSGSEIILSLNSGGDGMSPRASRPVNASEAANNVKFVQLHIYNAAGADVTAAALSAGTQNPIAWSAGPTDAVAPGDNPTPDHEASQTIKLNKLATDGSYTIVAYGYNDAADYTVSGGATASALFTATLPTGKTESEIFAGKSNFTVTNGNVAAGTITEVIMKRHVAGLLGYFKNVPILYPDPNALGAITAVRYIRVYASSHSNAFTFPSPTLVNATGNGTRTLVLEYNLSTLLVDFATQVSGALSDLTKKFVIPAKTGLTATVPNSILNGKFLIPFAAVPITTTFTIQLEGLEVLGASPVLKSWDVVNTALSPADTKSYDVKQNYFYSIGKKNLSASTDGGTPGDPSDDDQPIDLSQETVITVTVNDAWTTIYNLGIE